jgi:hypothetical protein
MPQYCGGTDLEQHRVGALGVNEARVPSESEVLGTVGAVREQR